MSSSANKSSPAGKQWEEKWDSLAWSFQDLCRDPEPLLFLCNEALGQSLFDSSLKNDFDSACVKRDYNGMYRLLFPIVYEFMHPADTVVQSNDYLLKKIRIRGIRLLDNRYSDILQQKPDHRDSLPLRAKKLKQKTGSHTDARERREPMASNTILSADAGISWPVITIIAAILILSFMVINKLRRNSGGTAVSSVAPDRPRTQSSSHSRREQKNVYTQKDQDMLELVHTLSQIYQRTDQYLNHRS